MMLRKRSMLLILALITIVSCGGGGGGGGTSSAISTSTPVNMEINLKGDVSKVPIGKIDSGRIAAPAKSSLENDQKLELNGSPFNNGGLNIVTAGKVLEYSNTINPSTTATIKKDGSAFLTLGFSDNTPLENQVKDYVHTKYASQLPNLTLTMEKDSILFTSWGGSVKLSQVVGNLFSQTVNKPVIIGNDYKELLLMDGKFTIDKNANLDNPNDAYNKVKIINSSITNQAGIEIKGTRNNLIGIGQKETKNSGVNYTGVLLKNDGTINLSGENVIGMYRTGYRSGKVENNGNITVGKNSVGMYVLDRDYDSGRPNEEDVLNTGNINVGENSIGMYYEDVPLDDFNYFGGANFNGGMHNTGNIRSNSKNVIGMYMNSNSTDLRDSLNQKMDSEKFLINTGNIELLGDSSIGMLAKGSRNYSVANVGTIRIGDSLDKNNPSIGMYTDSDELSLNNMEIINIGKNSIGIYGVKNKGVVKNIGYSIGSGYSVRNHSDGKIELNGKGAIGIYLDDGAIGINDGSITTTNVDGGSIGVVGIKDSQFTNNGTISVNEGSVGIYGNGDNAVLKNEGTITAGRGSVGMYSAKGATVENNKTIKLTGDDAIGMYLADNSIGINNGEITTDEIVNRAIGAVIGKNAEFTNNGKIVINSNEGTGIVIANGGIIKNYGDIQITGENASREKRVDNIVVKVEGLANTLSSARKTVSPLGIYVDSLGRTKPIEGLANLGLKSADLLIGAEATEKTNDTEVTVGDDVLAPFNNSMQTSNIKNWNVKTGSLVWQANPEILNNKIAKVTLKKLSYANFADDEMTQDVARGLDEKYKVANSNDKEIFNYLNTVSSKKTFADTYREVSGNQYANVQQRISKTDDILNNRISDLQKENADESGHHVSTFFDKNKHSSKVQGIADSDSSAYGISYLFNNADAKQGIYAGAINNNFKLKDNGRSKENISMLEVGGYKTFDVNSLEWTLDGNGFVSQNNMKRRFIVGNNSYENKANYNAYGVNLTNELGKTFNVGGNFTVKPYAALKLGYGRFNKIKEKDGTLNVEVKANDYYSVRPGAGVEFGFSSPVSAKGTKFKASLGLGYDHELGKVDDRVNEVKFTDTNTRIRLKSAKDEKKGNFRSDLKVGFETGKFDVSVNGGYDTKDKNSHVGVGLGVSF